MEQFKNFWGERFIPFKKTEEEAWQELQGRLKDHAVPAGKVLTLRPVWAAAAAIALLVATYLLMAPSHKTLQFATVSGQTQEVTLPDGSVVNLAPTSKIDFEENWGATRVVNLEGQAFFTVKTGSNFQVRTDKGCVSVLGTSFDVNTTRGLEVFCKTGKVLVEYSGQKKVLTPGMISKIQNNDLIALNNEIDKSKWLEGSLSFENESLELVLAELERFYNVEITCENIQGKMYTGQFTLNNLEEALTLVCAPYGMNYKIDNDMKITIQ